jgi:hypothetical protein
MPRIAKINEFAMVGMYIWTLPDGQEQQERYRKWKAGLDKLKRRREGNEGISKVEGT